jgi:uncharacterized protein YunC (DUF1805 family)
MRWRRELNAYHEREMSGTWYWFPGDMTNAPLIMKFGKHWYVLCGDSDVSIFNYEQRCIVKNRLEKWKNDILIMPSLKAAKAAVALGVK